ncbi:hypothetical protein RKD23_007211 [Streptomyces sp. SAI-170]
MVVRPSPLRRGRSSSARPTPSLLRNSAGGGRLDWRRGHEVDSARWRAIELSGGGGGGVSGVGREARLRGESAGQGEPDREAGAGAAARPGDQSGPGEGGASASRTVPEAGRPTPESAELDQRTGPGAYGEGAGRARRSTGPGHRARENTNEPSPATEPSPEAGQSVSRPGRASETPRGRRRGGRQPSRAVGSSRRPGRTYEPNSPATGPAPPAGPTHEPGERTHPGRCRGMSRPCQQPAPPRGRHRGVSHCPADQPAPASHLCRLSPKRDSPEKTSRSTRRVQASPRMSTVRATDRAGPRGRSVSCAAPWRSHDETGLLSRSPQPNPSAEALNHCCPPPCSLPRPVRPWTWRSGPPRRVPSPCRTAPRGSVPRCCPSDRRRRRP